MFQIKFLFKDNKVLSYLRLADLHCIIPLGVISARCKRSPFVITDLYRIILRGVICAQYHLLLM